MHTFHDWKHFPSSLIEDLRRDVSPIREGWLSKYSDFRRDRTFIGNLLKMEILKDRNKMMRPFLWFLSQLTFFWDLMKNGWKENSIGDCYWGFWQPVVLLERVTRNIGNSQKLKFGWETKCRKGDIFWVPSSLLKSLIHFFVILKNQLTDACLF